jgi:hypothetical protein
MHENVSVLFLNNQFVFPTLLHLIQIRFVYVIVFLVVLAHDRSLRVIILSKCDLRIKYPILIELNLLLVFFDVAKVNAARVCVVIVQIHRVKIRSCITLRGLVVEIHVLDQVTIFKVCGELFRVRGGI